MCHSLRKSLHKLVRNMTTSELNQALLKNRRFAFAPLLPPIFLTIFSSSNRRLNQIPLPLF